MARKDKRALAILACDVCKRRNYITYKSQAMRTKRLQLRKYCRWCRQHTLHKETR